MQDSSRDIKREILKVSREYTTVQRQIKEITEEIQQLTDNERQEESSLETKLEREKRIQLEEFKRDILQPLSEVRQRHYRNLEKLKQEKSDALKNTTLQKFKESVSSESVLTKLKPSLERAYEIIEGNLGKDFIERIQEGFHKEKIKINSSSVELILEHFQNTFDKLEGKPLDKSLNPEVLRERLETLMRKGYGNKGKSVILGSSALILGVGILILSPVYLIYTATISVRKIRNIKEYQKLLYDYTLINTNLNRIQEGEQILANRLYKKALQEIEDKYSKTILEAQQEYSKADRNYTLRESSVEGEFEFRDDKIQQDYSVAITSFTTKKDRLKEKKVELEEELSDLSRKISELNEKLKETLEEIKDYYLAGTYDKQILPDKILIDVTEREVSTLDYKPGASLVFADSNTNMINFFTLWLTQVRAQMDVRAYKSYVIDTLSMGITSSQFYGDSGSTVLYDDDESIKELLESMQTAQRRRAKYCKVDYNNLEEYNQAMLDNGSVTESYRLIFILNPPASLLGNPMFLPLLNTGSDVGIYITVFVETQDVSEEYLNILRYMRNIYEVSYDGVTRMASDKAYEFLETAIKQTP